jgi:1,4-alpha-glucan branching enzyme
MKSRDVYVVTFELLPKLLSKEVKVHEASVVGNFNDWDPSKTPMKISSKKTFIAKIELKRGRDYEFRYMVNRQYWLNDENADAYIPSGHGEDNCLLKLS